MPRKAWEHGQENRRFCWKPIKVYKEKKRVFIYEFFFWGFARVYIPRGFWASHDVLGPESWRFQKRD